MVHLDVPLFPQDEENGEYLVFLPGVESTPSSRVSHTIDEGSDELTITCRTSYEEDTEEPKGRFTIPIGASNKDQVEQIQSLNVINPTDIDAEQLTDDPNLQSQLRDLFDHINGIETEAT